MTVRIRTIVTIALLVVASWVALLVSAFVIFEVVVPLSAPASASYSVILEYGVLKAAMGGALLLIWLYSFYVLRDSYSRITGLDETPSSSASHQTPDGSKTA